MYIRDNSIQDTPIKFYRLKLITCFIYFEGFTGNQCQINIDDCNINGKHLCQNGGRCVDGVNTYTCDCPPNYTGAYCTEDVDECSLNENVCLNGATCTNTNGNYSCICVNG